MFKPERAAEGGAGLPRHHYSISELSERFGMTMRTLRFYEEKGLLNPGRRGNRRLYTLADVNAIADIVRLKAMGLAIADIQSVMKAVRGHNVEIACANVLRLARQRLAEIEVEMESLRKASGYAESAADRIARGERWFESA